MTPPRVVAGGPQQGGFSASDWAVGGQQVDAGAQQEGACACGGVEQAQGEAGGGRLSIFLMLRIFIRGVARKSPSFFCYYTWFSAICESRRAVSSGGSFGRPLAPRAVPVTSALMINLWSG